MNSKPSKLLLALLILAFSAGNLFANQRIVRTINDGWLFSRGGDASVLVNIPHSWNAHDTCSGAAYAPIRAAYASMTSLPGRGCTCASKGPTKSAPSL